MRRVDTPRAPGRRAGRHDTHCRTADKAALKAARFPLPCGTGAPISPDMIRPSPTVERLLAGIVLGVAFLFMASVFAPDLTEARPPARIDQPAPPEPSADPHEGLAPLGTIEDDRYLIRIYASEQGPLYSIYDRADGRELGVLMTAEDAAATFPDLPLPEMDFGTESPVLIGATDQPDL